MNLRFESNNIRLRVNYQELGFLKKFGSVRSRTLLPSGLEFIYEVIATQDPNLEGRVLKTQPFSLSICISELELERLLSLENKDLGFDIKHSHGQQEIHIRFEVDKKSISKPKKKSA